LAEAPNLCSATRTVFQITTVVFSTFLKCFAAAVRNRAVANGYSTPPVVYRCFQSSLRDLRP